VRGEVTGKGGEAGQEGKKRERRVGKIL